MSALSMHNQKKSNDSIQRPLDQSDTEASCDSLMDALNQTNFTSQRSSSSSSTDSTCMSMSPSVKSHESRKRRGSSEDKDEGGGTVTIHLSCGSNLATTISSPSDSSSSSSSSSSPSSLSTSSQPSATNVCAALARPGFVRIGPTFSSHRRKSSIPEQDQEVATALAGQKPYRAVLQPPVAPVDFLLRVLKAHHYDVEPVPTLKTAFYHTTPRPDQVVAYDMELVRAVRSSEIDHLIALYKSGHSIDACNRFGESIIHMACRRGKPDMVDFLVTNGGLSVNISDDFGRTPLHDACWTATPSFEVVKIILEINRYMVILCDSRKSLPLSYIHEDHWGSWCEFIMQHKDKYWNISSAGDWDQHLADVRAGKIPNSCSSEGVEAAAVP